LPLMDIWTRRRCDVGEQLAEARALSRHRS
jgi:hypothetical protein